MADAFPLEDEPGAGRLDDLRIRRIRPLVSPALLQAELPADAAVAAFVDASRRAVADAVHGRDGRLLAVVGPCSIHDVGQAMEYAQRLRRLAVELDERLLVVMRVYFEKPRTTVGWKGLVNDPRLDGSCRVNEGLRLARGLLLDVARLGLPAGTEFLDLLSPQYLSDLIAWGAIGARTTESPSHRQLASGLSCAIGFKNGTDGNVQTAADALVASAAPHAFMGVTKMGVAAVFETAGNGDGHVILRGGARGPNHGAAAIGEACSVLRASGVLDRVLVDCSHGNAEKRFERQVEVADGIAAQLRNGERRILGVMVESHLHEGKQSLVPGVPLRHGVSITDACLGWEATETLLRRLADAVDARPGSVAT